MNSKHLVHVLNFKNCSPPTITVHLFLNLVFCEIVGLVEITK